MSIINDSLDIRSSFANLCTFGDVSKLGTISFEKEVTSYITKLRSSAYDFAAIKDALYWSDVVNRIKSTILDVLFSKFPRIPDLGLPKLDFRNILRVLPDISKVRDCLKICLDTDLDFPDLWIQKFLNNDLSFVDLSQLVSILNKINLGSTDFSLPELSLLANYFPDYDLSLLLPSVDPDVLDLFTSLPINLDFIFELPDGLSIFKNVTDLAPDFISIDGELDVSGLLSKLADVFEYSDEILDLLSSSLSITVINNLGKLLGVNRDVLITVVSCLKFYRSGSVYDLVISLCKTSLAKDLASALGINPETFMTILSTTTNVVSLVHGILSGNPMAIISALDSLGVVNKLLDFIHIPRETFDTVVAILSAICNSNPITAALGLLLYFCGGTLIGAAIELFNHIKNLDFNAIFKFFAAYGELLAACLSEALGKILELFGKPDEASWPSVSILFDDLKLTLQSATSNSYIATLISNPRAQGYDELTSTYLLFYSDETKYYGTKFAVR